MNLLETHSIMDLHADYKAGRASPLDDVRSALICAIKKNADSVFTKLTPERALAAAEQSNRRYGLGQSIGPLDGVTVVWKDLFDQCGEVTTAGSKTRDFLPAAQTNARCVDILEDAGVCSLGRTNLSEFAFSGLGINPAFGTPANALSNDCALTPGGSSSGSAVAVALKIATVGIGTDTSGSIRIPAALNGIFGFRPSQSRYDRSGVFPLSSSLDTVGTFARSVQDIVVVDRVLAKPSPWLDNGPLNRTIFDLADSLETQWNDEMYNQYALPLRTFERKGYKIIKKRLKSIRRTKELFQKYGTLVAIEAKELHRKTIEGGGRDLVDPIVLARLRSAPDIQPSTHAEYVQERHNAVAAAQHEIGSAIIACPTVPQFAPELSHLITSPEIAADMNARMLSNTMIASFLDLPGIAMPTSRVAGPLPGSILLSCGQGRDGQLLRHVEALLDQADPSKI
jgi:aspartyl-tRNA(Asn)/glutamyl-tRNA(Gln) amidotransferase subunit A